MREWKIIVLGAVAAATLLMRPAQVVAANGILEQPGLCTVVAADPPYIYPAANWEPFFRRHLYRYALVPTCVPIIVPAQPVVSVRY
jgi:hypothetical protein